MALLLKRARGTHPGNVRGALHGIAQVWGRRADSTDTMLTYEAQSHAPADAVWPLLARPSRWHEWAPHVRGADGLGDDEIEAGRRGAARLLGLVRIPVEVIAKQPGRSWTWSAGPVTFVHRVRPRSDGGCVVGVDVQAPAPLEPALALTYGPVMDLLVHHLARTAPSRG